MESEVDMATELVVTVKLALVAPAGTVTLGGTEATAGWLLPSDTTAPPAGAAAFKVTVAVEELPPTTLLGFSVREVTIGEPPPGGVMTSGGDLNTVPKLNREMVAEVVAATGVVETVKLALMAPAGLVTMAGTAAAGLLLEG